MKEQFHIRNVVKEDLGRVVDLCEQHADYEQSDYCKTGKEDELYKAIFKEYPDIYCWVIVKASRIIGYVTLAPQFSTWDAEGYLYLDCLYIEDGHRGLGIGAAVMQKIKRFGATKGYNLVQWQTPIFNAGAIRFYQREGAMGKKKVRFFLSI